MWKRLNRKGPTSFTPVAWGALPANYGAKVIVIGASITKTGWATLRDWFDARSGTFREAELWLFTTPLEEADGFTHATRHSMIR